MGVNKKNRAGPLGYAPFTVITKKRPVVEKGRGHTFKGTPAPLVAQGLGNIAGS